jgi:hypothetical protein
MTPYGDRRREGHYDPDGTAGPIQTTAYAPGGGTYTLEDKTLSDLRDEAKSRGIPYYGTKAELAQRIADADDDGA